MKLHYAMFFILLYILPFNLSATAYHTAHIVAKAKPAVAFIVTETNHFELAYNNPSSWQEILRPFYEFFYPSEQGLGTGVLISEIGHIITNEHVIKNCTKVLVILPQENGQMQVHPAQVLGADARTDVALIKIEEPARLFPYLHFADSHKLHVGEKIICIGNPMGIHSTVTEGIISGLDRNHLAGEIEGYIQTDTAINPGNSGGPFLNKSGEIIGIVSWKIRRAGYDNLGFGIPSHIVKAIAEQILETGKVAQGFFGAEFEKNQEVIFDWPLFLDKHEGARIRSIVSQSPAERAGLKPGDLILQLGAIAIHSPQSLRNEVCIFPPETRLPLAFERNGMLFEAEITLGSEQHARKYARMCLEPLLF